MRLVEDNPSSLSLVEIYKQRCAKKGIEHDNPISRYYDRLATVQARGTQASHQVPLGPKAAGVAAGTHCFSHGSPVSWQVLQWLSGRVAWKSSSQGTSILCSGIEWESL